jgi:hypothetical protein
MDAAARRAYRRHAHPMGRNGQVDKACGRVFLHQRAHFLPEDSLEEVGSATASLVAKVLAGQIGRRPDGRVDRR